MDKLISFLKALSDILNIISEKLKSINTSMQNESTSLKIKQYGIFAVVGIILGIFAGIYYFK